MLVAKFAPPPVLHFDLGPGHGSSGELTIRTSSVHKVMRTTARTPFGVLLQTVVEPMCATRETLQPEGAQKPHSA